MSMMSVDEAILVHVVNAGDMKPVTAVEEIEPEHFSCETFVLQASTSNNPQAMNANILQLDPLRKDAIILAADNPVVVCHTFRQTQDAANQVAGVPFPDGAYLPVGIPLPVSGTGPLWVVATTTVSATRVSVMQNRGGSA